MLNTVAMSAEAKSLQLISFLLSEKIAAKTQVAIMYVVQTSSRTYARAPPAIPLQTGHFHPRPSVILIFKIDAKNKKEYVIPGRARRNTLSVRPYDTTAQ